MNNQSDRERLIVEERRKFRRKARKVIENMRGLMTPEERRNFVRAIVGDYNPLSPDEAESFISENSILIEEGKDHLTPP